MTVFGAEVIQETDFELLKPFLEKFTVQFSPGMLQDFRIIAMPVNSNLLPPALAAVAVEHRVGQ